MFYFALCREHSHQLRQTLFLRLCPGGPLGYVSGEPGGWRRLHSSIVQSPQLPEQCSWGLDPCPSTVPGKGTAVGTSIHAGRWSRKQLLSNVIVQGSPLQTDKTRHGWIRFHYVRPRWYCGTRFCHGWHLVSKWICCEVSRSQKKEKTVHSTKSLSRQKCVFCCLTHVCTALVCLHWTTLILSWSSFFFFFLKGCSTDYTVFHFMQTGKNASLPKLLRCSVLYLLHRNFLLRTDFEGWRHFFKSMLDVFLNGKDDFTPLCFRWSELTVHSHELELAFNMLSQSISSSPTLSGLPFPPLFGSSFDMGLNQNSCGVRSTFWSWYL